MGIELDDRGRTGEFPELLLDFGEVAVLDQPVGFGAFGAFDEKIFLGGLAARRR